MLHMVTLLQNVCMVCQTLAQRLSSVSCVATRPPLKLYQTNEVDLCSVSDPGPVQPDVLADAHMITCSSTCSVFHSLTHWVRGHEARATHLANHNVIQCCVELKPQLPLPLKVRGRGASTGMQTLHNVPAGLTLLRPKQPYKQEQA